MNDMASTVLAVTDLTSASYKLVGFAAFIAGPTNGEVILVSTYGGVGGGRRSEPPARRQLCITGLLTEGLFSLKNSLSNPVTGGAPGRR